MKKAKKIISFVLSAILATSVFTACSVPSSGSSSQDTLTATETIPLNFWFSGGKTAAGVLTQIVEDFNNSQTLYKVSTVTQGNYSETYEKVQAGIAGKNAPDIALLNVTDATSLADRGLLENLNPFMEKDTSFDKEDYISSFFSQGIGKDGSVFALPAYGTTQILYYNRQAFETAGVDATTIKTWQDLEKAAQKIAVKQGDETSVYGWEPMWGSGNLMDAALSNGATVLSEDGTKVLINSKEWVEVWEGFRKWIHDEQIMKIHYGGQGWEYWYKTIDDALLGKAGGYTGSSGDQADLDFTIVGAIEQPGWGSNPSAPVASALELVVPKRNNEQAAQGAFEFMKFFTSAENQAKWSMATGYIAVRKSTLEVEEYKAYVEENPHALVPMNQAMHGSVLPVDPTGGKIWDALSVAADQVEIEGIPAQIALDEAQQKAQQALDEVLQK